MRVLIYGAGVIGSLYAALFAEAGIPTAVYARGERLAELKREGLRYRKNGHCRRAEITLLSRLREDDVYDFIFLAVREMQARAALLELRVNQSPTIVTMVNTLQDYADWEELCGTGRILPAFPGAGGGFENGILEAALTPPKEKLSFFEKYVIAKTSARFTATVSGTSGSESATASAPPKITPCMSI